MHYSRRRYIASRRFINQTMAGVPHNQSRLPKLAAWMGILLVPPLLINVFILLPGALHVAQTGICPAAPPDLPAYPCSVENYVIRMTLGPWALPGQLLLLFGWIGVVVPTGAGLYALVKWLLQVFR